MNHTPWRNSHSRCMWPPIHYNKPLCLFIHLLFGYSHTYFLILSVKCDFHGNKYQRINPSICCPRSDHSLWTQVEKFSLVNFSGKGKPTPNSVGMVRGLGRKQIGPGRSKPLALSAVEGVTHSHSLPASQKHIPGSKVPRKSTGEKKASSSCGGDRMTEKTPKVCAVCFSNY